MTKSKRPVEAIDRIAVKNIYEGEFKDRTSSDEILCDDALYIEFRRSYVSVTEEVVDDYSLKKTLLNMRKCGQLSKQKTKHSRRFTSGIDRLAVKNIYEGEFVGRATSDEILCDGGLYVEFRQIYEAITKSTVDDYSLKKTLISMRKRKTLPKQTSAANGSDD